MGSQTVGRYWATEQLYTYITFSAVLNSEKRFSFLLLWKLVPLETFSYSVMSATISMWVALKFISLNLTSPFILYPYIQLPTWLQVDLSPSSGINPTKTTLDHLCLPLSLLCLILVDCSWWHLHLLSFSFHKSWVIVIIFSLFLPTFNLFLDFFHSASKRDLTSFFCQLLGPSLLYHSPGLKNNHPLVIPPVQHSCPSPVSSLHISGIIYTLT